MASDEESKASSVSDILLFVADTLSGESQAIPLILHMLNYRWSRSRDFMKRDFTSEDVISALNGLVKSGLVYLIPAEMTEGWFNQSIEESDLPEDIKWQWFRLTPKGRQALDGWHLPKATQDRFADLVKAVPVPIFTAYDWLISETGEELSFSDFSQFVNNVLGYKIIQLLQIPATADKSGVSSNKDISEEDGIRLTRVPDDLERYYAGSSQTDSKSSDFEYILTIAPAPPPFEPIALIPDPLDVLERIAQDSPGMKKWVDQLGSVRHFVITEENGVSVKKIIPIGKYAWTTPDYDQSALEGIARRRLDTGRSGIEKMIIRHIVVDTDNNVAGDYYGPAIDDPFEK